MDFEISRECGYGQKKNNRKQARESHAVLLFTRKRLLSAFTPVSWLSERSSSTIYSAHDLPMH
jgi:hypothetical protein